MNSSCGIADLAVRIDVLQRGGGARSSAPWGYASSDARTGGVRRASGGGGFIEVEVIYLGKES